jgi:hypothetical protein
MPCWWPVLWHHTIKLIENITELPTRWNTVYLKVYKIFFYHIHFSTTLVRNVTNFTWQEWQNHGTNTQYRTLNDVHIHTYTRYFTLYKMLIQSFWFFEHGIILKKEYGLSEDGMHAMLGRYMMLVIPLKKQEFYIYTVISRVISCVHWWSH